MSNSHQVDYRLVGDDMQMVEIELDPGETVIAEAGAMNYMEEGIRFEARMGDGSNPDAGVLGKLGSIARRALTGESLFMTHFTHDGPGKARVAFAAPYPGKIAAIDLSTVGGELIVQKDAFLCAALGTSISVAFNRKIGSGFFGGEGLFLATLRGHGKVWLQSLPFSRLADRIIASAPSSGGSQKGEGSALGGLWRLFGGR